ncbi:MAG TPA: hypothetical protein EYO33_15010 [Phycisphaerales bacterium]|nr:hypothetical protein [Phycisphaerales bacterium]
MSFKPPSGPNYEEMDPSKAAPGTKPGLTQDGRPNFERTPIQILKGQQAETYCKLLEGLIRGGKPNNTFPSGRGLANLIYLLRPSTNRGLVDEVRVNLRNGLPDEPDIGRVIADKDICHKVLRSHDIASVRSRQDDASRRLVNRLDYYLDVEKRELPERYRLDLKLKRVNEKEQSADFIAVFERFDPGEGVFTMYQIHLRHQSDRWSKPKVELQGDDLKYTEEFRNVISRYSSDEAEFAFILLSDVPGITVQEISRGRIGPLWMKGVPCPPQVAELLEKNPGNVILNFPYEKVFVPEVEGKEDANRDPFGRLYRQSLGAENKELADARAAKLGYVVHKDRKFSCSKPILNDLKKLCADLGKPCVIYPGR